MLWHLALWIAFASAAVWWNRSRSIGLVPAYLIGLWLLHWVTSSLYLLPWHSGTDESLVRVGLRESVYGVAGFLVGCLLAGLAQKRRPTSQRPASDYSRAARVYVLVGLLSYLVLLPVASAIPSGTSLVSAGWSLTIVGLALGAASGWSEGGDPRLVAWMILVLCLPLMTLIARGFISYGVLSAIPVLTFIACFYRPRWRFAAAVLLLAYGSLSLFVTYLRDRGDIRTVVWGGASFTDRVSAIAATATDVELFDPGNPLHLRRLDARLNQNRLLGAAVETLRFEQRPFARGGTLFEALLALIPRALWADKPMVAGSGDLVSHYTGIRFDGETSVGVGHILEFYINFGRVGVVCGLALLGFSLTILDDRSRYAFHLGDTANLTLYYLPATALLQSGGSLVETTTSCAAGWVVAVICARALPRDWTRARLPSELPRNERDRVRAPGRTRPFPPPPTS